jgi:hypothetical protein
LICSSVTSKRKARTCPFGPSKTATAFEVDRQDLLRGEELRDAVQEHGPHQGRGSLLPPVARRSTSARVVGLQSLLFGRPGLFRLRLAIGEAPALYDPGGQLLVTVVLRGWP